MKNLLHKLFNDFGGGRQDGGFVLGFTGFQDGDEIEPAVGQILTHAEEEAVQMVTQLDWLARIEKNTTWMAEMGMWKRGLGTKTHLSINFQRLSPDLEVGENQLPSRGSSPVNTPASVGQN